MRAVIEPENMHWLEEFWKTCRRKFKLPWTDFSRNLHFKDAEDSEGSEEHVIGNRKENPHYVMTETGKFFPELMLKGEIVSD